MVALLIGCYALLHLIGTRGFISMSNLDLMGRTILANSGGVSVEKVVTAFPPMSYAAAIAVDAIAPGLGFGIPHLISGTLAAILLASWYKTMRDSGFATTRSMLATLLLGSNPLFWRAAAEGPSFMLLHLGYWLFVLGMFQLRRGHRINDLILVALGLAMVGFAHPFGLFLVFGALPFIALAIPPDRLRTSPASVFLVLLFPLAFALLAFCYVNWIFAGEPFRFLLSLSRESIGLGTTNSISPGLSQASGGLLPGALAAIAIVAACPIAVSMFVLTYRLPALRLAILGLIGHLVSSALLASAFGLLPPLGLVASLSVTLSVATAVRWPHERPDRPGILMLLTAGLAACVLIAAVDPASETQRWRGSLFGFPVSHGDAELSAIATKIKDRDQILFDAEAIPSVVALRGSAKGIWTADSLPFQLSALRQTVDADMIIVRDPQSAQGSDRVGRLFPQIYDQGYPGYARIYTGERWRIYELSHGGKR